MSQLAVIPALAQQTATVIFSHGLGDTAAGWSFLAEYLQNKHKHIGFVFPTASKIPITCNGGMRMPGWYDVFDFGNINAVEDEPGMLRSAMTLNHLITDQVDVHGIDSKRIVIGGFSQGATMALLTGLTSERGLGGVAVLSGYLPLRNKFKSMISSTNSKIPIFWATGLVDPVVRIEYARLSKKELETMNYTLDYHEYANLGHGADPAELDQLSQWLQKVLP